jgi:hypothetical protein
MNCSLKKSQREFRGRMPLVLKSGSERIKTKKGEKGKEPFSQCGD